MANPPDVQRALEWGIAQLVRPVAVDQAALAQRKATAPLRPAKPQEPCDIGLFGDDSKQTDLMDFVG